jgi:hypothetical protein
MLTTIHGRARPRNSLAGAAKQFVLAARALLAVAATFQVCSVAHAAEAEDRAQLATCVDAHMTADDSLVMKRLIFLFLSDVLQSDADIQGDAAAKRDTASASAATLINRVVEHDCKTEVHALVVDKPQGGAIKALIEDISKPMLSALTTGLPKAAATFGLGILKQLDAATVADLQLMDTPLGIPNPQTSQNARLSRAALSGVKLRLAFETSLNPDCSVIGETVIRLVKNPSHGTATIEDSKDFTAFEAANQRYRCNEQKVRGTAVYYKSVSGYAGPDFASYQIIYPSGIQRQIDVDITVN